MFGLFAAKRLDSWTAIFLVTTVATSVTGFLFPFHAFCRRTGCIVSLSCWRLQSSRATPFSSPVPGADLRHQRHDCSLSQCFRVDRAGFSRRCRP